MKIDGYISVTEYAKSREVSYDTVAHWISRGRLDATKVNGHWYIPYGSKPHLNVSRKRAHKSTAPELNAWDGSKIKERRLAMNLSQKDLAKIAGVSWITIQRVEHDKFESLYNLPLLLTLVLMKLEEDEL